MGMSCIYSIISLFLDNLINWEWLGQLGAGITWGFCHSFVWLLGQDDLKTGLSGNSAREDPHVASPCGRSPWRGLGTLGRFQKELSRVRSAEEPDRRYLAFSGSASEIILYPFRCPVLVKGVKSPLRFKGRRCRSWLSMGGASVNLHLLLKQQHCNIINGRNHDNVG